MYKYRPFINPGLVKGGSEVFDNIADGLAEFLM